MLFSSFHYMLDFYCSENKQKPQRMQMSDSVFHLTCISVYQLSGAHAVEFKACNSSKLAFSSDIIGFLQVKSTNRFSTIKLHAQRQHFIFRFIRSINCDHRFHYIIVIFFSRIFSENSYRRWSKWYKSQTDKQTR